MDIKAEILDYINCNEVTGALLLTGSWGCGKSYLMKQIAKELNEHKKAAVAVISLFGLDSVASINKRVKDEYSSFKLGTMGKSVKKISKGMTTLAKDGLAVAETVFSGVAGLSAASKGLSALMSYDVLGFIEIQNTIGKDENQRKFVIVFDDLERSNITQKDLLGAINEFIENKQIKTIIVADEDKISESDKGNNDYKEYKEKLISRTLHMTTDYNSLIENLVAAYPETSKGYRDFLIESRDLLKLVFAESKSNNIRTLKCALADFERVYAAWKETDVPPDNMKWALYTFGAEMFISKSPNQKEDSQKSDNSIFLYQKEEQYKYKRQHKSDFSTFRSWINEGVWDKHDFIIELQNKYITEEETPLYRFLVYRFWDLQQEDIDKGLPEAVSLAYDGKLSRDELISLIGKIHHLRVNSIILPCDIDYRRMEKGLQIRFENIKKGEITEPKSHTFIEINNIDEEASVLYKMIEKFEQRIVTAKNRELYLKFLDGDETVSDFSLKNHYYEEFDSEWLELFKEKYLGASNSDKRGYALSLLELTFVSNEFSNEENTETTKANFNKLIDWLESLKSDDSITKLINKSFAQEIRKMKCFGSEKSEV